MGVAVGPALTGVGGGVLVGVGRGVAVRVGGGVGVKVVVGGTAVVVGNTVGVVCETVGTEPVEVAVGVTASGWAQPAINNKNRNDRQFLKANILPL
jgi:hypothetical protein